MLRTPAAMVSSSFLNSKNYLIDEKICEPHSVIFDYLVFDVCRRDLPIQSPLRFARTATFIPDWYTSKSCTWKQLNGYYLNGDISGENTYSSRDAAMTRCIKLDDRCSAVKQRGNYYQLVFNALTSPRKSSAGTKIL